jgi:hypothetical protein
MIRVSRPLLAAGFLLVVLVPANQARAEDGGAANCASGACDACGGGCGGCGGHAKAWLHGLFAHYEPYLTWYAPIPYWFPNYFFGPPYTSYQLCHYWTPPAVSAQIVRERILAINSQNPALLPPAKEPLPLPKLDKKEAPKNLP